VNSIAARARSLSGAAIAQEAGSIASTLWPPARQQLAQAVWGAGHIGPDTENILFDCLPLLGLDPAMTVVELGSGLGVLSRRMHLSGGVYTFGFDPDAGLVEAAMQDAFVSGFRRKTQFDTLDVDKPSFSRFRDGSVDRWVVHNIVQQFSDIGVILEPIARLTVLKGQILLADVFVAKGAKRSKSLAKWLSANPNVTGDIDWEQARAALADLGFEVHVQVNASEGLSQAISVAWDSYLSRVTQGDVSVKSLTPALAEAQRWMSMRQAMKSGALEYRRIIATLRG